MLILQFINKNTNLYQFLLKFQKKKKKRRKKMKEGDESQEGVIAERIFEEKVPRFCLNILKTYMCACRNLVPFQIGLNQRAMQ